MLKTAVISKKNRLIAASLAAFFILAFPIWQIMRYEKVLANGKVFKIYCRAYDPHDAFRGRYVRYSLSEEVDYDVILPEKESSEESNYIYINNAYVLIEKDDDGFMKYKEILRKRPSSGDYLSCRAFRHIKWDEEKMEKDFAGSMANDFSDVNDVMTDEYTTEITLTGLDRYYMNEKLAPAAEKAMQKAMDEDDKSCYLEIKALNGLAVPIQLYINDQKIEDYLRQQ